jgi:hypothetical protein
MLYFLFLESCTTIEVGKEIVKAGNSVKTTVSEIITNKEDDSKIIEEKNIEAEAESQIEAEIETEIEAEKEIIIIEQKEQKNIVETQQKISQINFLGNSLNEIKKILGETKLAREDGNTYLLRYDSKSCRLFLFFNLQIINKKVEYFELRDTKGVLLKSRQSIEECYREFKLI